MITLLPSNSRGHFNHGWLNTYHTFSFGDYYNPAQMGFRKLRVINEDFVEPGQGFPTHSHQNMEIVTYVLEGALEHRDSMGNHSMIRPGEVQRMSAGTGVTHSEFNSSSVEQVHLLQIWILPNQAGLPPSYEQKEYLEDQRRNQFLLVASPDGRENSVVIHQDVQLSVSLLEAGKLLSVPFNPKRHGWVQAAKGSFFLNGKLLQAGDGASLSEESALEFEAKEKSEILLFDLA